MTLLLINKSFKPKAPKMEGKFVITLAYSKNEFDTYHEDSQIVLCVVAKDALITVKDPW